MTNEVRTTVEQLYQIIGVQNVEILMLRKQVADVKAQLIALTPPEPLPAA
jgi:hypothetical protein